MNKAKNVLSYLSAVLGASLAISALIMPYAVIFYGLLMVPPLLPMPTVPLSNPTALAVAEFILGVVMSLLSKLIIPVVGSAYVGTKLWISHPTTIIIAIVLIVWAFYALIEVTQRYQAIKQ